MTMVGRISFGCALALALIAASCDSMPLTAPSGSTVTITTASSFVPNGGSTEVTAFVYESGGTPVQNGTTVRFTTNLGRLDPVETQTLNGYAYAIFAASDLSGVANVRATSGSVGGATGEGQTGSTNSVNITVGAAAVATVTLGANPGSVPSTGGTVELVATVTASGESGLSRLPGVLVTFASTEGDLASASVVTDANGLARTTLTTTRTASVTASAGGITSTAVTVTRRDPPGVVTASVAATPVTAVPGSGGQTVNFATTVTVTPADATIQPTKFDWDFGDGSSATTNGPNIGHVYTTGEMTAKTVTVTITLTNGQTVVASTQFLLGDF
jgi:hypothetical protein